jgi:Glycerophosphoryl diester phosphodiesterase
VGIGIFTYAIYMAAVAAAAFLTICFTEKSLAVATFISINEKMSNYLALVIFSISLAANFALVTHLFFEYKKENNEYFYFDNSVESIFLKLRSYKRIFAFLGIGFVVLNIILAYNILRNDTPLVYVDFDTIKITSHRGFSRGVPENTLPAIEKAIEEKADYVEMDVRQTKDRKLVLLHDENVRRTTGINKNIGNMTYDEVILLDAGKWVSEEYAGTRIPTLEEALETCKGKINMNLDLKEDRNAVGLEESVVGFINQYEMENQCVITSTSRTILENVKKLNPNIRTGYITYQIQRSDFKNSTIDFFSINSCFASENLLQSVHEEGKEVLVWTVNTKSELERMKNLGVDNIITDDPSYAKEVLFENGNGSSFLKLLRTMMAY